MWVTNGILTEKINCCEYGKYLEKGFKKVLDTKGLEDLVKVGKNGIWRTVHKDEVKSYIDKGFKPAKCIEPQPSQEGLYIIDDYTIGRLDNSRNPIDS